VKKTRGQKSRVRVPLSFKYLPTMETFEKNENFRKIVQKVCIFLFLFVKMGKRRLHFKPTTGMSNNSNHIKSKENLDLNYTFKNIWLVLKQTKKFGENFFWKIDANSGIIIDVEYLENEASD
jgi:hypothetical protein